MWRGEPRSIPLDLLGYLEAPRFSHGSGSAGTCLALPRLDLHRQGEAVTEAIEHPTTTDAERLEHALTILHQFGKDLAWIKLLARRVEQSATEERAREQACEIGLLSDEMRQAVGGFLRPARRDARPDLACVIAEAVQATRRNRGSADIEVSISRSARAVCVDGRIVLILANLVENAVSASAPGSPVRVKACVSADRLRIQVADLGEGMDPETLEHCFDRGFTTRAAAGGTGTGLYACARLAERIGAQLEIDSKPGKGTRAELTLRLSPAGKRRDALPASVRHSA